MKTYSQKPADVVRKWYLLDASQAPLGRVATAAASLLIGKHKPSVTAHVDGGDFVIITNAKKLKVTGNKLSGKVYYRHSGYPGGLKTKALQDVMDEDATQVLFHAIRGMLPVNKLRDGRLARLKIYETEEHSHEAQKPENYKLEGAK